MKFKVKADPVRVDRDRQRDYPPIEELADAIYWREKGDPKPLAAYVAKVDAVKAKHPKATK